TRDEGPRTENGPSTEDGPGTKAQGPRTTTTVFSTRIPSSLAPNRLAQAVVEQRRSGRAFIDLTESNPTQAGFEYPPDLLAPLARTTSTSTDRGRSISGASSARSRRGRVR